MNLLAINGSPRKGKATDTLIDKAIEGVKSKVPDCDIKKINLIDHDIKFCRNCLACRETKTKEPIAKCIIKDDMSDIYEEILKSDNLILGTPVHMGSTTGIMVTFLERICWVFGKPGKNYLNVKGCPMPRSDKQRKAIIIVTSGIIPPMWKKLCNYATPLIKVTIHDSLNAKTVGKMYAGDIEHRSVEQYLDKAYNLGTKLV